MNNAKYSHTQGLFSESPPSTKGIEVIYFYLFFFNRDYYSAFKKANKDSDTIWPLTYTTGETSLKEQHTTQTKQKNWNRKAQP